MGIEYHETGKLQVKRTWDHDMLLDIKQGKWSLDEVKKYADSKLDRLNKVYLQSALPETVDLEKIEALVVSAVRSIIT